MNREAPSITRRVDAKLPKSELKKFTGRPQDWQEFWDSFKSTIHKNEELSDVDKFTYLKYYLEEGPRSGSGKIVLEHFDYLKQIWGGSPSTNQLACGISSEKLNDDQRSSKGQDSLHEEESDISSEGNKSSENDITDHSTDDSQPTVVIRKRKITENPAPRLIDNKRKDMERQLSASQRDQLLIKAGCTI
eukprot:Seg453.10 transcript_id=Seg453.10/GoldUCD/mRNA.D3Y31 product="hypothetical protein" protein_id=Seg453.10/GoldUCD/D3Y31